jgi:hypothetical protein
LNREKRKSPNSIFVGFLSDFNEDRVRAKLAAESLGYPSYAKPLEFGNYIKQMTCCEFVLTPRGYGIDTHRLWEAFYSGSKPISVANSSHRAFPFMSAVLRDNWRDSILQRSTEIIQKSQRFNEVISTIQRLKATVQSAQG